MIFQHRQNRFRITLLCLSMASVPSVSFADWSGGYAGLSIGQVTTGESRAEGGEDPFESTIEADPIFSGFAGYQLQQGSFVFGGELSASINTGADQTIEDTDESFSFDARLVELSARAGYDLGEAMIYGFAGLSRLDGDGDFGEETFDGTHFGLGVDYRLNEQLTVGSTFTTRRFTEDLGAGEEGIVDLDTLAIRASFAF